MPRGSYDYRCPFAKGFHIPNLPPELYGGLRQFAEQENLSSWSVVCMAVHALLTTHQNYATFRETEFPKLKAKYPGARRGAGTTEE